MQPTGNLTQRSKANEWYGKNHLGQILCRLCSTQHRDDENFIVHLESQRHAKNLQSIERAKEQHMREQEALKALQAKQQHDEHAEMINGALGGVAVGGGPSGPGGPRRAPRIGKPSVNYHVEPDHATGRCKVLFELGYPLAATDGDDAAMRPLHRWLNTYEQSVEAKDDGTVYLVFACEPYETVAYAFPARLPISTADSNAKRAASDEAAEDEYLCRWDAVRKVYTLMFTIG
jgi:splicing factor 3A subunit 2